MEPVESSQERKLGLEDYLQIPDDGLRHQILDGVEHVSPAPTTKHQDVLGELHVILRPYARAHGLGKVYLAPTDVVLGEHDIVQPDILFVAAERVSGMDCGNRVTGSPDLAIEILSPSTRRLDEVLKRRRYAAQGVGEYWIVDPEADSIRVHVLEDGAYRTVADLHASDGDVLESRLFPGLKIELKQVFEES